MSPLVVQEFDGFDQFAGLRAQWDAIVAREGLSPAHEYDWLSTLWELNREDRELLVLVFRDGNDVVGIAPLVKETERRKGLKVQVLKSLGLFHQLHGSRMIFSGREKEGVEALFDHLRENQDEWVLWFMSFQCGEEQETVFQSFLQKHNYPFRIFPGERSPYLLLKETWDEKLKQLQPRFRTALRSREKRLREKGALEFRMLEEPSECEEGLETIREIEEDSWKTEAGTAITRQQFQWRFYSSYARVAAAHGTLRIPILYLDGEPVAYDYALYRKGVYYLLKTSYKRSWQEAYPGFVLRKFVVEWVYGHQGHEIDFLGKDEEWKMKWTTAVREHVEYHAFNRHWKAQYLLSFQKVKAWLKDDK